MLPGLFSFDGKPVPYITNDVVAAVTWGFVLLALGQQHKTPLLLRPAWPLWLALALLGGAVASGLWRGMLPASLAGVWLLYLAAATALLLAASQPSHHDHAHWFCSALVLAGVLSALVACIQVLAPQLADGAFIAKSHLPGRAVGNFRQPNHLAGQLLWGLAAWAAVAHRGCWFSIGWPKALSATVGVLMLLALVLSASRMGMLGVALLAIWGWRSQRLNRWARGGLLAAPVVYATCWLVVGWWASQTGHDFGAATRLNTEGLESGSRMQLWQDGWTLLQRHSWVGVGLGGFNFAWTLTPLPNRHPVFMDHLHNLPLHLAVELGVPWAVFILVLLAWTGWQAVRQSRQALGDEGVSRNAVLMVLVMVGLHSLLEYPLWYGYFLWPTAWALGLVLSPLRAECDDSAGASLTSGPHTGRTGRTSGLTLLGLGVSMVLGGTLANMDYQKVAAIYMPRARTMTMAQQISQGQTSLLFGHYADYALVLTESPKAQLNPAFASAIHLMLDDRLLMAWAKALDTAGQHDQASYVAQRLHEFKNADSEAFFAACGASPRQPPPFQCINPSQTERWQQLMTPQANTDR